MATLRCRDRRIGSSKRQPQLTPQDNEVIVGTVARNEMDTMADTSCAGANWVKLEDTGFVCDVYPFKEGYEAIRDVSIATCATLVEGDSGADFILIGHEMLYFGRSMDRSLLNQNQIRDHIRHCDGHLQDDYTRTDEEFGIRTPDMFIPFDMDGIVIYFESRVPSKDELETLPHIVITAKDRWQPHVHPLRTKAPTIAGVTSRLCHDLAKPTRELWDMSPSITERILWDMSPTLDEAEIRNRMIKSVRITESPRTRVSTTESSRIGAVMAQHRHTKVTPHQ